MFKLEMKEGTDDNDYRSQLIITDNDGEREYWDGGEPEDNLFYRDWYWVYTELEKAYKTGLADGKATS